MTYRNATLVACLTVVLGGLSQVAAGATLCVQKNPSPGCPYSSIGAAVAAASAGDVIQVSQGTYKEDVIVGKAISLVGANRNNTIIDAKGLKNGIYVDGLDNAGCVAFLFRASRCRMRTSRASSSPMPRGLRSRAIMC